MVTKRTPTPRKASSTSSASAGQASETRRQGQQQYAAQGTRTRREESTAARTQADRPRTVASRAASSSRRTQADAGNSWFSNLLSYFDENRHVPLFILAGLAALMLLILLFSRCTAPKVEEEPMPDATVLEAEQQQEETVAPPTNPAAKTSLNDYTWDEVSQIADKISAASSDSDAIYIAKQYNLVRSDGTLDPTATKSVELADGTTAHVRIIGFNQDAKSDGSGRAGMTFMFADPVTAMAYNTSGTIDGGWGSSDISYYLGVDFWGQLPQELTAQISEVTKRTNSPDAVVEDYTEDEEEGTSTTTTAQTAGANIAETGDIMWLPSYVEIMGQGTAALGQEGSQYQLFRERAYAASSAATTSTTTEEGTQDSASEDGTDETEASQTSADVLNDSSSIFVMRQAEQATNWWLRSIDADNSMAYYVNTSGTATTATPDNSYAVAPCFSI